MGIFEKKMNFEFSAESATKRLSEEALWEQVADEIDKGELRKGLWLKAKSEGAGDKNKAESIYIKLRMQSLIDEAVLNEEARQYEAAKKHAQEEEELRKKSGELTLEEWFEFFKNYGYYYIEDHKGYHAKKTNNPDASMPIFYFSHTEESVAALAKWVKNNPA